MCLKTLRSQVSDKALMWANIFTRSVPPTADCQAYILELRTFGKDARQ